MFPAARAVLLSIILCVRVRILCVLRKLSAAEQIKPELPFRLLWSPFSTDSAACFLSFYHSTPLHLKQRKFYIICVQESYVTKQVSDIWKKRMGR